jgi:hypothetical protein
LFQDPYGDPAARIVADIDLLVRENELDVAWGTLLNFGYRPQPLKWLNNDKHHHYAPLFRKGEYGRIELHRDVVFYSEYLSTSPAWRESQPLKVDGLAMRVLSPTHQVLTNFVNSELVDENHGRGVISLRDLHEITALSQKPVGIHWDLIRKSVARSENEHVLRAYIYLAHRLLRLELPAGFRPTKKCNSHYHRVRLCLQSDWLRFFDEKMRGFSTGRHPHDSGLSAATLGRVGYAAHLFSRCVEVALRRVIHRKAHGTRIPA